jgi:tetratricopeptide (TPR) repeat protein
MAESALLPYRSRISHMNRMLMVLPTIDTNGTLRHRAFFDALATTDEASDAWRAARAGLVALRLFDAWSEYRHGGHASLATMRAEDKAFKYEVDAVQNVIAELPAKGAERRLLSTIVARIVEAHDGEPPRLVAPLFAYARALHLRSAWALAADVYAIVWDSYTGDGVIGDVDGDVATAVALYLGVCYRTIGETERAGQAYRAAGALASTRGDDRSVLRARLGQAKISAASGELARAHDGFWSIIAGATASEYGEVRAMAWHELALVVRQCGRYEDAITYAHEAWLAMTDVLERERILVTLATLLLQGGYPDVSREANALLAETAKEPIARWAATINLIEIATIERRELDFMRHRRELAGAGMPPSLVAEFDYYVGQGHLAFGQLSLAAAAFDRAVTVAQRYGLAEVSERAQAARAALSAGRALAPPKHTTVVPRPARVNRVAEAIHGARLLAAAGG